jgi:hypothetical protein
MSAKVRLTKIGRGLEELDKVEHLSIDLQAMARWNFWAAATTGIAVVCQIVRELIG